MWALVSFVKRGKIRRKVVEYLKAGPATPTELAKGLNLHRPSVSRALLELEQKNLVKCLTPREKMGRIYALTDSGQKIAEKAGRTA